jgi:ABC-type lipoprotein export system ATPase subunit
MITVKNINKYYNKNKLSEIHVLNDIDLTFPDTGLTILKGVSGSGKTTLLNVIGGLDKVHNGEISIDNQMMTTYHPKVWDSLRTNKIGYIFQNYYLIPKLSVYENIALVLKLIGVQDEAEIKRRVHYILKQVGMYNFRKRHANQLSGGQQQRVAIARALIKNPKIIIADEPTGNLDSRSTIDVMNIIKKISKEKLVVLVTHEQSIADFYGDRIIEISDGKITNDQLNEASKSLDFEDKDTYYLKDFKHQQTQGNISFYSNQNNIDLTKDVKVRLIYEDDCLLLDVDGAIKKVRLTSEDAGVKVIDKHKDQIGKDAFLETTYQTDEIVVDTKQNKENISTFSNNLRKAIIHFMKMTRDKKTMLVGLILSGMIMGVATSVIGNRFFDTYIGENELENYVYYYKQTYDMEPEEITSFGEDDPDFWLNPYNAEFIRVQIPSVYTSSTIYELEAKLDLIDHISEDDIIYGRMPNNMYEIVIDLSVYENNDEPYSKLTKYGVWNAEQLIGEKVLARDAEMTIVGISDVRSQVIFADRTALTLLAYRSFGITSYFLSLDLLEDIELVDGRMPTRGSQEVLIPYDYAGGIPEWAFDNDVYIRNGMVITGTYDKTTIPYTQTLYLAYNEDIESHVFKQTIQDMRIYSSNPEELLNHLEARDFVVSWPYGDALIEAKIEQDKLMPVFYISILILLFTGLGFYYMMRSSMMSRMYEISVYRALGMKKSSIMKGFNTELIVITTFTTLVGYLLAALLISRFQEASYLNSIAYLNVSSFLLGIVLVYLINILFGRISIRQKLQKTPAELLSNYDM